MVLLLYGPGGRVAVGGAWRDDAGAVRARHRHRRNLRW